ncbi:hypothetical protein GCM10023149_43700 [Mucilaginibacter gynuensis]|uniref:Carboxypeptidase-like protein n=1 Tax=Mucilaginibacter gynuensis TaxID=1302236 RepID=A0ABP8H8G5_9SPHI
MRINLLLLLFLLPICCFAQYSISGKIVNAIDGSPFADASVFLSKTTVGTKSNADGTFTLNNALPGQYTLAVSAIGFETYNQEILIDKSITIADIKLIPKTTVLQDVVIRIDPNREKYVKIFTEQFLGKYDNARQSKILNPEVVNFYFDKITNILTATADDFLEIENKALGYKVKYLLKDFEYADNDGSGKTSYEGDFLFEKLKGKLKDEARWQRNRLNAYKGSARHFFRSAIGNIIPDEGFTVYRIKREVNDGTEDTAFIRSRIDYLSQKVIDGRPVKLNDSLQYYIKKRDGIPVLRLDKAELSPLDYITNTDRKGLYAIRLDTQPKDLLFVIYNNRKDERAIYDFFNGSFSTNKQATIISFDKSYATFDINGMLNSSKSLTFSGYWTRLRVADLLPVDYQPGK